MILVWTGLTLKLGVREEQNQNFLCEENETEMSSQKLQTERKFRMESLFEYMCYDNYVKLIATR